MPHPHQPASHDSSTLHEKIATATYDVGVLGLDDDDAMDSLWDVFDPDGDGSIDLRSLKLTLQGACSAPCEHGLLGPCKAEEPRPATGEGAPPPRHSSCAAGSLRRRGSCAAPDGLLGRDLAAGGGTRRSSCEPCATEGTARRTSVVSTAQTVGDPRPATPTTGVAQPTSVAPLPVGAGRRGSSCSQPAGRRSSIG